MVDLNAVVSIDIALQVGGSSETVEVTGEPPVSGYDHDAVGCGGEGHGT